MTNKIIISDTSCLIVLDKIEQLFILKQLFTVIITTAIVREEFGEGFPEWILIKSAQNKNKQKELEQYVDAGEASAIALALETDNCLLIIDEKKGRKLANDLNIEIAGTLQILLLAKTRGIIKSLSEVIAGLEQVNFRISSQLKKEMLKKANEQ